jgi:hypothetical protein
MGNNCGCVEKEGENEVVVGQPGKMNKAVDAIVAKDASLRSSDFDKDDVKYDTIRESLKSQKDNFQETDKDVLKLQKLIEEEGLEYVEEVRLP